MPGTQKFAGFCCSVIIFLVRIRMNELNKPINKAKEHLHLEKFKESIQLNHNNLPAGTKKGRATRVDCNSPLFDHQRIPGSSLKESKCRARVTGMQMKFFQYMTFFQWSSYIDPDPANVAGLAMLVPSPLKEACYHICFCSVLCSCHLFLREASYQNLALGLPC